MAHGSERFGSSMSNCYWCFRSNQAMRTAATVRRQATTIPAVAIERSVRIRSISATTKTTTPTAARIVAGTSSHLKVLRRGPRLRSTTAAVLVAGGIDHGSM
jgi:hypothetical protein